MSTDSEASIKLTASFLYKSFLNTGEIYVWSYMMGISRHFTDTYVLYVCILSHATRTCHGAALVPGRPCHLAEHPAR